MYSISMHDFGDFWMEYGKLLRYLDNKYYYLLFFVLIPAWGIPRCFVFPRTSISCSIWGFPRTPDMIVLIVCQLALWIMDCIWWFMILSMLKAAVTGKLNKDVRSNSSSDEEDTKQPPKSSTTENEPASKNEQEQSSPKNETPSPADKKK